MAPPRLLLALLLLLVHATSHRACCVAALEVSAPRIAIERHTALRLRPAAGEPAFDKVVAAHGCLLNRNDGQHGGGFKLTLPPHTRGEKEFMSGLIMPAKLLGSGELECQVHKVITTGNTTISVASADRQNKVSGDTRWRATHFEHYAIFQPDFGRRPYVRENQGEIVAAIDESLFGTPLKISAGSLVNATVVVHGPWLKINFSLTRVQSTWYSLVNITLTLPTGEEIVHPRVFARAPPPERSSGSGRRRSMPVVWQVDASRRALRADGVPVIANGWFSGGYDHESAGIAPRNIYPFINSGQSMDSWMHTQAALSQASRMAEWGRTGQTFQRVGVGYQSACGADCPSPNRWDHNLSDTLLVLDAAAASGVPVLLNIGIDSLASKGYNKTLGGIDPSVEPPATNLTSCSGEPYCEWVRSNVLAFKDHPAISGFYACDDCCHISKGKAALVEYKHISNIKASLFELDPYHLLYGTSACDDLWMWTEEGAGLGIDVMMKEAYGHATGSCGDLWGNASMRDMNRCNGGWRARQPGLLRSHPMLFAPTQNMPSPGALGAARKLRTHAYAGLISEGTIANNFYVYNEFQHKLWLLNHEVSRFSAEISELLPSLLSTVHWGMAANEIPVAQAFAAPLGLPTTGLPSSSAAILSGVWVEEPVADSSRDACAHVVVVNTGNYPTMFDLRLDNLPRFLIEGLKHNISDDQTTRAIEMTRIFDGSCVLQAGAGDAACSLTNPTAGYAINATLTHATSTFNASVRDMIDNQATNVYRIGCGLHASQEAAAVGPPLIADGGFEGVSLAQPGLLYAGGGLGGGSHGGWSGGLQLANLTDDRVRLEASAAEPHAGRYAGRLQLPTNDPVTLIVPLSPAAGTASGRYKLTVYGRSSPPGVQLAVVQVYSERGGGGHSLPCASVATTSASSGDTNGTTLTAAWSAVSEVVTLGNGNLGNNEQGDKWRHGKPLLCGPALVLSSPFSLGGAVFLDSAVLTPLV